MALRNPIPNPSLSRPEIFIAFNRFMAPGYSEINSLSAKLRFKSGVCPILREYSKFPLLNKSVPSVKNGRFSLNCCSNGPKFKITLSYLVWPKSGTKIASKVNASLIPYLTSNPPFNSPFVFCVSLPDK